MQTIKKTGPLLYRVTTNKGDKSIRPGKMRLHFVRYETLEFDVNDRTFESMTFETHDANCEEAREIAKLVKL